MTKENRKKKFYEPNKFLDTYPMRKINEKSRFERQKFHKYIQQIISLNLSIKFHGKI